MNARAKKTATRDAKATPRELAVYLRRSEGTLANWRSQGKGPRYTKVGGILYDWTDVDEWLKSLSRGKAA